MTATLKQKVHGFIGKGEREISLSSAVFNVPVNNQMLSETVVLMQKNARMPTAHAKGRGEKRGGGRKPWRQKGTGRARHGSIRSPLWKGGGVTHGPSKERNYAVKINKRVLKKALRMVLSGKLRDEEIIVVDSLSVKSHKTQKTAEKIASLFNNEEYKENRVLLVPEKATVTLQRAVSNLPHVAVKEARSISALDLLSVKHAICSADAIKVLQKRLS